MSSPIDSLSATLKNKIERLYAPQANVRLMAAVHISTLGQDALPAVDALITALADSCANVRQAAALALGAIGSAAGRASVGPLTRALCDAHHGVRRNAVLALAKMGSDATLALPALEQTLRDANTQVRRAAALALKQINDVPRLAA